MSCCLNMLKEKVKPGTAASCLTLDRQVKQWKKASGSRYLHELLIQKCKFRQKKGDSQAQRAAVQPIDIDRWKLKNGQQFTLLRRITNSKV